MGCYLASVVQVDHLQKTPPQNINLGDDHYVKNPLFWQDMIEKDDFMVRFSEIRRKRAFRTLLTISNSL